MPGPLPEPNARRRNKPTIPTTALPATGHPGPYPTAPKGVPLGPRGKAWWRWAWRTPQAAAWSPGDLYALAHRATLEDDLAALAWADEFDWEALLGAATPRAAIDNLEAAVRRLKALAGGRLAILREARELDDRYGLTAKGMATLRWKVVDTPGAEPEAEASDEVGERRAKRQARGVGG